MRRITELLFGEFRLSLWRSAFAFARGKRILVGRGFRVFGLKNIVQAAQSRMNLGTQFYGFATGSARGIVRVRGQLDVGDAVAIGVGSRLDVGPNGHLSIGDRTYFSPNAQVVAMDRIAIGSDCAVGWNVQLLDEDFHAVADADGQTKPTSSPISIGNHVWIGSHSKIFKGVTIADNCIVAGNSTVTKDFLEPNSLIGGSPARVLRVGVDWT